MLEKFRDLSFGGKIAVLFSAVILVVVSLISLGVLIKNVIDTGTVAPNPSSSSNPSPSATPTPTESQSQEPIDQNVIDDNSVKGISDGYMMSEKFFEAICTINGKKYNEYVSGFKKYLSTDNIVQPMPETSYNNIEYQTCEIHAGNPGEAGTDGNGHYYSSMATTVITKYKGITEETVLNAPVDVSIYKENGAWKVYAISIG